MRRSAFWRIASWFLTVTMPFSLLANDTGAGMLYSNGQVWLNGVHVPNSSAIFAGDLVQTPSDAPANIHTPGSSITVLSDSLVKFAASSLDLDHGGISVATSKGVAATIGGLRVAPASNNWTEFNVSDMNGMVRILARKGDLTITDDSGTVNLPEGQQTTRDDSATQNTSSPGDTNNKKKKKRAAGALPAGQGGSLNSPVVIGAGAAAVAGVTLWVILQGDDAISPSKPH